MCEKAVKIGIIKKINMPLIVINWWAIKEYEKTKNDNKIRKSIFFINFGFCNVFLIIIINKIIEEICINLCLKKNLENSNGNKKLENLSSPMLIVKKMYCSINDKNEIFPMNKVNKKNKIIIADPESI